MSTRDENACITTDAAPTFYRKVLSCHKYLFFFNLFFSCTWEIIRKYFMQLFNRLWSASIVWVAEEEINAEHSSHLPEWSFHASILIN